MPVQVLTVRFDPALGVMDDAPLLEFQKDKVITAVREKFFTHKDAPYLAFVIEYQPGAAMAPSPPVLAEAKSKRTKKNLPTSDELRATLPPDQHPVFDALRKWRRVKADDEAIPAWSVLTNRQLMELTALAPTTKAGVMKVEGIGQKKAEKYADAILKAIAEAKTEEVPPFEPTEAVS